MTAQLRTYLLSLVYLITHHLPGLTMVSPVEPCGDQAQVASVASVARHLVTTWAQWQVADIIFIKIRIIELDISGFLSRSHKM